MGVGGGGVVGGRGPIVDTTLWRISDRGRADWFFSDCVSFSLCASCRADLKS